MAIEEVLLRNYQPLLKEFNELFANLSEEQQNEVLETIDNEVFYTNDILGLQKSIEKGKRLVINLKPNIKLGFFFK